MEVIKLENMGYREDMIMPGDIFLLQVSVILSLIFNIFLMDYEDIALPPVLSYFEVS